MTPTLRQGRRIALIVVVVSGLLVAGHFALVEIRIKCSSAVSLYFGDEVKLHGWYFGDLSRRLLHKFTVMGPLNRDSEYSDLVLQVGERKLELNGATTDDVLAFGAAPTPGRAGHFSLDIGGHPIWFQFTAGALGNVEVHAGQADATAAGVSLVSVLIPGSSRKLDLPCSGEEAIAFFGEPSRSVYQSRGGSVTVSGK